MRSVKIMMMGLVTCLVFMGCKNKSEDPFAMEAFDPYDNDLGKRIEEYHNVTSPNALNAKGGERSIYIDFSSGINSALKDTEIKDLINGCYNQLSGSGIICLYKLGHHIVSLAECTDKSLPPDFYNAGTYGDNFAPIEAAVDSITRKKNDALLITDFEEWQGNEEQVSRPYLKPYFVKWLAEGNTIHFFIKPYSEGKTLKNIYFTVFSYGKPANPGMLSRIEAKFIGSSITRYDLTNNAFSLFQKYPTEKSGGIAYGTKGSDRKKNIFDLKDGYLNGYKENNSNFEFYPFGLDWKYINEGYAANQIPHFFSKLFIDLRNENAYIYSDFDVKVYDVTDDFIKFSKCNEAGNHKPKLAKGNGGEDKFADDEKDNIAKTCYNPNGKIKDEWVYKPEHLSPVAETFVLNKELFSHNKVDHKDSVELAVDFDSKFKIKNIANPDGILRIDIVLNSVKPNFDNPLLDKFKWINSHDIPNVALYESIKNTLSEPAVMPSNKVIYSYYIKTLR